MSKPDNTIGNVAIGLAVVVLGFVVYKMFINPTMVSTSTPATAKQTTNASNPAALAASIAAATNAVSSLFGTTNSSAGSLNSYLPGVGTDTTGGLDQAYTSAAYDPDSDSAAIAAATSASMAQAGESDLNSWDFSL
ncbi:hypothetical protein PQQ96_06015 [Paraburkholderia sediminicola]|uniref:hypothetical protein n=1 Tax=Paraburkholderia sediminicola TaxID=458836 RepID=UPI0038B83D03